jgi:phosphopantothenoylcysteine decarboxylase/phosphopantothenate--cysteine ligase
MPFCAMPKPSGKTIILGVSGSVAAYKAAELARLWVRAGHAVHTVMTDAATHFVGAATFRALTGRPVLTGLWEPAPAPIGRPVETGLDDAAMPVSDGMAHIHLSRHADLIVVAPATADVMARLAQGRADDLLSALCLARACPLVLAPAMNREMWGHPATQRNLARLREDGVRIIGPETGDQACGETGYGRMSEPGDIFAAVEAVLGPKPLAGKTVLITAGPTFEPIDPVRGLSNLSSGKMGFALAQAAQEAGAEVRLVSGPVCLETPAGVARTRVTTAEEMLQAVMADVKHADIFISVAAVADYRPAHPSQHKIKKGSDSLSVDLVPNTDILAMVASLPEPPFCVGFAAETENLPEHAERKRRSKKLPMLVANLAQDTLGRDEAEVQVLDDAGTHLLPKASKLAQARRIVRHAIELFNLSKSRQS